MQYALGYGERSAFTSTIVAYPYESNYTVVRSDVSNAQDTSINYLFNTSIHKDGSAYDGFQIISPSGDYTGTLTVYGLKESS